jgi:immune inhibitor A
MMISTTFVSKKLVPRLVAGAAAMLLVCAAFRGPAGVTRGDREDADWHRSAAPAIGEQAAPAVQTARATSRGFSTTPLSPFAAEMLALQGRPISNPLPNFVNRGKKFNPQGGLVGPLAVDPVQKVLVIFVEFTTPPPGGPEKRLDLSYFDDLLFGTEYDPPEYAPYPGHPTDRTLKNYYQEVSYGKLDIVTLKKPSKLGWAQSGRSYDYYCRADGVHDNGLGPYPQNSQGLVIDAIKAVDAAVDFSRYAVNGEVPNLIVVPAGARAEFNGDPSLIWSQQWDLSDGTGLDGYWADGVKINAYAMVPEIMGDPTGFIMGIPLGPYPPTVGAFAHEWAHALGLPDQYDYGHESDGTGIYSLMAYGSWGLWEPESDDLDPMPFLGSSPTHLDAWSKYRLGFLTPIQVDFDTPVSAVLPPVELLPIVYRMDVPNSGGREYFLLENRQFLGFDEGLRSIATPMYQGNGSHGLAIWHIDDTVLTRNYWFPNEAENWKTFRAEGNRKAWTGETHYGISVIQADNQWHLERSFWREGDPADFFPGVLGVTRFGNDTFPNSSSYYFWPGSEPKYGFSGVTVDNIEEDDAGVVTADLYYASMMEPVVP